jgi:hypothetical protein
MQPTIMDGTKMQAVGKLTLYIRPDGSLVVTTGNKMTHMVVTADEARGLFDYLLLYARYFEQASNGHGVDTEPLHQLERQSQ